MTVPGAAVSAGRSDRFPTTVVLWAVAIVAWAGTIAWALGDDMGAMPGTMGLGVVEFIAMWTLMMAAMMLPSVTPFVTTYARTVTSQRPARLGGLGIGYLAAWAVAGVGAYFLARLFDAAASEGEWAARTLAVAAFAAAGVYQLTPLKRRCLSHCRSPIAHLVHYLSFRGPVRDLRSGFLHGLFCLGCCWGLMVLLVAFGVMNVLAMVGLAAVIAVEKLWRHGEQFSRAVAAAAFVYAVVVAVVPSAAPGLDPGRARMPMADMEVDDNRDMPPQDAPGGRVDGEMGPDMEAPTTTGMDMGG